jgi:hypothetical protein
MELHPWHGEDLEMYMKAGRLFSYLVALGFFAIPPSLRSRPAAQATPGARGHRVPDIDRERVVDDAGLVRAGGPSIAAVAVEDQVSEGTRATAAIAVAAISARPFISDSWYSTEFRPRNKA